MTEKQHPDDVLRDLPVQLTEEDLAQKAKELADAELKVDGLKEEARGLNKDKRAAEGHRLELARIVESGEEERQVACRWIEYIEENCKRLVRQDNGNVVDEEALTADDHQQGLNLVPDGDDENDQGAPDGA